MATFKELGDKYQAKLESVNNFKIGKTGQKIKDRYEEFYSGVYSEYQPIGSSKDAKTVDEFEEYMIKRFMNLENCDNKQIGGGQMAESDKYIVYIVYNDIIELSFNM